MFKEVKKFKAQCDGCAVETTVETTRGTQRPMEEQELEGWFLQSIPSSGSFDDWVPQHQKLLCPTCKEKHDFLWKETLDAKSS